MKLCILYRFNKFWRDISVININFFLRNNQTRTLLRDGINNMILYLIAMKS